MQLRRITSPILAISSNDHRFVTIPKDDLIQLAGEDTAPGLRPILLRDQRLLAFNRDLEERSEPFSTHAGLSATGAGLADDRRAYPRYPIRLECAYILTEVPGSRPARTLNISTGGVLLESMDPLSSNDSIDLAIDWPYLLNEACPLQLLMSGRIVRIEGTQFAVASEHHEFRPHLAP